MKKIYALLVAVFFGNSLTAQMMQGSFSLDPYIGVPNWANSLFFNQYDGNQVNVQNYQVEGGMLSYGARIEYMASDRVGVGADVNYELSGYSYKFDDYVYDPNGNILTDANGDYLINQYQTTYSAKKIRAMFRLNYHFVQEEKIDMYAGFAGGYKSVNRSSVTNPETSSFDDANLNGALIPVSLRIAIGTKLFFTQNVGAHVELGAFGGGLLQAGLTVKF